MMKATGLLSVWLLSAALAAAKVEDINDMTLFLDNNFDATQQNERRLQSAYDFGVVVTFGAGNYCMDFDKWCRNMQNGFMENYQADDFGSEEFGKAWVNSNVLCYVAQEMVSNSTAAMVAKGSWEINHQNGQTVRSMNLDAVINHVGLAFAEASAIATTNTSAEAMAFAYTNTDELCRYLGPDNGWGNTLCAQANSTAEVMGVAEAGGISSGSAKAQVGGIGAQESILYVEADNIERFTARFDASAGSFAFAQAKATVNAVSETFLVALATSYVETCYKFVNEACATTCQMRFDQDATFDVDGCIESACVAENCDYGYASNQADATNIGTSLGSTLATSFDQIMFTLDLLATYQNIEGSTDIEEQITFGFEGHGFSGADIHVECIRQIV